MRTRYGNRSTVRGRGADTRPLWTRSWGGAHIVLYMYSDGLLTCACHLDNIFRSGTIFWCSNTFFRAAKDIFVRQNIF